MEMIEGRFEASFDWDVVFTQRSANVGVQGQHCFFYHTHLRGLIGAAGRLYDSQNLDVLVQQELTSACSLPLSRECRLAVSCLVFMNKMDRNRNAPRGRGC